MIDLHCHILPGLDDGSGSLEESIEMAAMAADQGVRHIVATPHCRTGSAPDVIDGVVMLRELLQEAEIPIRLYTGMEIFGSFDTARLLREKKLLTLNGSRYPLIEFSFYTDGTAETEILQTVIDAGYTPLVAHPERYEYIHQQPELINQWKKMGCLFQVNRCSLLGRNGEDTQMMALELVERGFATVVATDAHSSRVRTPRAADAYEMLYHSVSPKAAEMLMIQNPKKIITNNLVPPVEPDWFR